MTIDRFRSAQVGAHIVGRWNGSRDRGSASVEMVLLTPVLVMLLLFVVYAGKAAQSLEHVRHAADQGARAASMVRRSAMGAEARRAVQADLAENGRLCPTASVTVAHYADSVTVIVTCWVDRSGFDLLGLTPRVITATSTEIVDRYRGGS